MTWPELGPADRVAPFHLHTPQASLDRLRSRLARSTGQWAEWLGYWHTGFDWRAAEARLNRLGLRRTELAGAQVQLLHARSPEPDALPLLVIQDRPSCFAEFLEVLGPLTDPRAYGADPAVAFHLLVPDPPGCGLSGPALDPAWSVELACLELAGRLGYQQPATLRLTGSSEPDPIDPAALLDRLLAGADLRLLDRDALLTVATVRWLAASSTADLPVSATGTGTADYRSLAALHDPELFVAEVRQSFAGQHVRAGRLGPDPARTVSRPDAAVA
jgi:hypothetical protein